MTKRWASAGSPFMTPVYTGKRPDCAVAQSSGSAAAPEPAAVEIARNDLEHDLAEALDRLRPGFGISALDALALILGELALEFDPGGGELQQALAAVALAGVLDNEALAHELAQHAREA